MVCVSHPANWGPFKTDLLRQAVALADLGVGVMHTTEPEAAAVSYARQERLAPGETIAVYDLGGGTFDAAVLCRTETGFAILGHPEGIERLGGIDIDAAVFAHVARAVGEPLADLDEDDPAAIAAMARLRAECTEAKEALSTDTDTSIPVLLPHYSAEVRLTRAELESMIRPPLYDSIEALNRALRSADVKAEDLAAVLLVGGSSRMPLVAQLVGAELGRPVAVDTHPKHAIALGASWLASGAAPREQHHTSNCPGGFAVSARFAGLRWPHRSQFPWRCPPRWCAIFHSTLRLAAKSAMRWRNGHSPQLEPLPQPRQS
jgi:molecular chaperone DnaK (HSP70)